MKYQVWDQYFREGGQERPHGEGDLNKALLESPGMGVPAPHGCLLLSTLPMSLANTPSAGQTSQKSTGARSFSSPTTLK